MRRPSLLGNAALALVSLIACLGLVELALRLCWRDYHLKFRPGPSPWATVFHPVRGWALAPSAHIAQGTTEFTVTETHDAQGFRGPDVSAEKSPGRTRVVALGDSMTYGHGVNDDETYAAVLQRLAPGIEVVNAGVPAYSGVQELLLLRDDVLPLAPDVVVLGYFWNDLLDALHSGYARFELVDGALRFVPPSPATPENPALHDRNDRRARRGHVLNRVLNQSYAYRFVSDRLKLLHLLTQHWFYDATGAPDVAPAELDSAWELDFALIREMRREVEQRGGHFLLLLIPDQLQVEPDVRVAGAPSYLDRIEPRLVAFADAEGIACLDLLPLLREARAREGEPYYYRFDRHWNARGHARSAALLHERLRSLGWIAAS